MRIDVVTIFPEYLAALDLSLVGKARRAGLLDLRVHDLRDWTDDRHRTVDDTPFGGGAGMVMRADVWGRALDELLAADGPARLVVPAPSGEVFTQRRAEALATEEHLVVACGRYEGIDARVVEHYRDRGVAVDELSLGDYVLNGGEVAALVMVEAVGRLLPGVVGNPHSLVEESHGEAGLLEYPVYTKPPVWEGREVPEVLLSGHHARIERWRRDEALRRTARRRPDMIAALGDGDLDARDREVLAESTEDLSDGGAPHEPRG
ncbi:tRNA (guanosine(37)-N1)-methyltransferase TrmD [Isoptericola sp. AK164]|uniref:tRNA (guanosine(37)-N1)-methyltransferase TrmD n=1 Tax=Isoptericola sp. AK164 TaxID=3024246 RepID=UPI0024189AB5|nr:tRNA (guanosine(37)-N1)-methyltransferase TrmD [Isoptericola sp. AK164]